MQTLSPLNQQAIKELITANWQKHHRIIAVSFFTVPIAFAAPSVLNRHDPFHITGRVVTAISLMVGGGLVIKSAGELENLQPQMEKIKAQQMNFLGHGLGAEIYIQEEELNLLAAKKVYELENQLDPEIPQFPPETETGKALITKELPDLQSSGNLSLGNSEISVNSETATLESDVSQQELDEISRAISEGFTDTQIVTDIMRYKGRQYKAGKERLDRIKKQLGANND